MAGPQSSFGGTPPGAQNGVSFNGASNAYELGGNLVKPTTINTSIANTLALTGLAAGSPATDTLIVTDPTGVVKFITVQGLPDFFRTGIGDQLPDGITDYNDQISHDGNLGLGITDASTVRARLDVNGSTILRNINLANFAANAVIGTAAATVDVASTINITQTTAGITLTLPNPTQTQAGRLLLVNNIGTQSVTVGGKTIAVGTGILYSWNGASWTPYVQAATLGSIDGHTDVDTTTVAPTVGQTLIWNGTNWVPGASTAAPTITTFTTAASTTIQPFPLVNTNGIAPTNTNFTNPSATRSMTLLITYDFGEMLYRFNLNEAVNLAMRGNCYYNGVRVNAPADFDRRGGVQGALSGTATQVVYTTATKSFTYVATLAPGATVPLAMDYDLNYNTPPASAGNGGRILCEPSTITVVGFLN